MSAIAIVYLGVDVLCGPHTAESGELSGEESAERVGTLARFIVAARQPTCGEEDRPEVHGGRCYTARATKRQLPQRVNHSSLVCTER